MPGGDGFICPGLDTGVLAIEQSLFAFIWKYSKKEQFVLLLLTAILFPLLYLTLELPKRIINDAISADQSIIYVDWLDMDLPQVTFLMVLCGAFLVSVTVHGLMKMRINTLKGILSERMLRRYRFGLISRIMRFPQPYLKRTSQGELVSMITSEAEPMGGMMGDAISLPVLQAGQMVTILAFLFLQSFWFGVAACALIPLQAWLIPKLQRQINLLNKERIKEVRHLAAEIGETASGAPTLRSNAGWRFRLMQVTRRLGTLFDIRLIVYKKKFFMKFLNNFINQLTPFFFYSVGGYLAIQGQVSVGSLVAALAAYKDLSSPWKELLNYYNRVQDMSLRWNLIADRFAPADMVEESLFDGGPDDVPHLEGDIELQSVTVVDLNGDAILENVSKAIPEGSLVAFSAADQEERRALADLLTRESLPVAGRVKIGGRDLNELHQKVIAGRIGFADATPYVFEGTFGQNIMMSLSQKPCKENEVPEDLRIEETRRDMENERSGNSMDSWHADWVDPAMAECKEHEDVRDWWLEVMDAIGSGNAMFRRGLDQVFVEKDHPALAGRLVALRPKIQEALRKEGLEGAYYRFDPEQYNPALPVSANLFYATPKQANIDYGHATVSDFLDLLTELGLADGMLRLSQEVVEMLNLTFGVDGTEHPLFRRLGLDPDDFRHKVELAEKGRSQGIGTLGHEDQIQMLTLPFEISAEQIGPAFSDDLKALILDLRHKQRVKLEGWVSDYFQPLSETGFAPGLSVLENALYGTLPTGSSGKGEAVRDVVSRVLVEEGVKPQVAELLFAMPTGIAGAGLPSAFVEPLSVSRAAMKKPDILILDGCLAAGTDEECRSIIRNLRNLLPKATIVFLEETIGQPEEFDETLEIEHGRIKDSGAAESGVEDNVASADLKKKMRALVSADLFSGLGRKQLRLLAFGAQWYEGKAGDYVFHRGDDAADGAYLILEGEAEMLFQDDSGRRDLIAVSGPGAVVGELALVRKEKRSLDMYIRSDLRALRLGEEEFLAVVENDAGTAFKILQVLAGYARAGG